MEPEPQAMLCKSSAPIHMSYLPQESSCKFIYPIWSLSGQQFIPREFGAARQKSQAIQDDPRFLQSGTSPTSDTFALTNGPTIRKTGECTPSSALRPDIPDDFL
jgi:hypothetical protein